MNAWLRWRLDERIAQAVRAMLRGGTRVSHYLFSIVGGCAVVLGLALWALPTLRGTFAAKMMPVVSAAVQAGPARLLQGNPLPAIGDGALASDSDTPEAVAAGYDGVFDGSGAGGASVSALNGLDPHALPTVTVASLARLIPAQRITADARDDRILVSTTEQQLVASFIARRYHVAQDPVSTLVRAAFDTGREVGLDPLLLLAVMAIESGFNPYAESGVGAQGLMQVMAKVHSDKFQYFGGTGAALEPITNIRVGALVLKDCIARGGSLAGGLRLYVGSTSLNDGGYGAKVMAERSRLRDVARGRPVPINAPQAPVPVVPVVPASTITASTSGGAKRVQVTLGGSPHPLATTRTTASSSVKPADDAALPDSGTRRVVASASELGA